MLDLVSQIVVERNITNAVYVWSGSCLLLFLLILWRMGLGKRALIAVGVSFVINIGWEVSMIITDSREFSSGYMFLPELIYHGFTELAPFVLFVMICFKLFGYIKSPKEEAERDEDIASIEDFKGEEESGGLSEDTSSDDEGAPRPKCKLMSSGVDSEVTQSNDHEGRISK